MLAKEPRHPYLTNNVQQSSLWMPKSSFLFNIFILITVRLLEPVDLTGKEILLTNQKVTWEQRIAIVFQMNQLITLKNTSNSSKQNWKSNKLRSAANLLGNSIICWETLSAHSVRLPKYPDGEQSCLCFRFKQTVTCRHEKSPVHCSQSTFWLVSFFSQLA